MLKKIMTAIVSGCLAISMIPTIAMAEEKTFSDVDYQNGWYVEDVNWISSLGIMNGYGNGEFGVGEELTRAEFAQLLANWAGVETKDIKKDTTNMIDMWDNQWYTGAANWAVEEGLIEGIDTEEGKVFAPNAPITREMTVTIMARLATNMGLDTTPINQNKTLGSMPDSKDISEYAESAVAWSLEQGVISGREYSDLDNYRFIKPGDSVLREEVAKIVRNVDSVTEGVFNNSGLKSEPVELDLAITLVEPENGTKRLANGDFTFYIAGNDTFIPVKNNGTNVELSGQINKVGFSTLVLTNERLNDNKWNPVPNIEVKVKTYINDSGVMVAEIIEPKEIKIELSEKIIIEEPELSEESKNVDIEK